MKTVIIDAQGGKIGRMLVEQILKLRPEAELIAIGTNTLATAAMLKAGASAGATGENPVVVNAAKADLIIGPIGIALANSMLGEVTPVMARAVAESPAKKLLIPTSKCGVMIPGAQELPLSELIRLAAEAAVTLMHDELTL